VIDPRRTETAELADFHLQVKPGTDAWCLAALLAVIVEEDLVDRAWIDAHTEGYERCASCWPRCRWRPTAQWPMLPRPTCAPWRGALRLRKSVSIFEDLGIPAGAALHAQQLPREAVYLLTGNSASRGGMNIHTRFASLTGSGAR